LYPRITTELIGNVLDFGCGIGDFLRFHTNATGVDVNPNNIDYCKRLGLRVKQLDVDGRIPFGNNSFSSVVMDNVIEHIPAECVDAMIEEVARVLESNGIIIAGVPGIKGYHSDDDHKVFYTEDNLNKLFDRHEFRVKKTFRMPLPWQFLEKYLTQYCVYTIFQVRH